MTRGSGKWREEGAVVLSEKEFNVAFCFLFVGFVAYAART